MKRFARHLRLAASILIIAVVCFLSPVAATAARERDWDIYCITGGDCALYDPDACGAAQPAANDATVASMDISDIVNKYGLHSAVVKQVDGAVIGAHKPDNPPASPASTMKLVIVDTVLQEGVNLNKSISVTRELLYDGTNDLGVSSITVKDAITKTLQASSNVGANVLMKSLGGVDEFTAKAHARGYNRTTVEAYYSSSALGKNKSSIGDQADAMDHLFSTGSGGYATARSALQSADDHYGVGGKARKWAGNSLVAGSVALFAKDGSDYIVGVYYEGDYTSAKAVEAVKNGTADLVTKIGKGGAIVSGKAVGNLPPRGRNVGASYYTGATGYKGDSLPGTYSYAELGNGSAMGGLKHKQKLAITYKGKTVVAEKLDVGAGGDTVNGKERAIDLYQDKTAKFLGLDSEGVGVVHVQGVDRDTPLGPVSSSDLTPPSGSDSGGGDEACCPSTGSTSHAGNAAATSGTWNSGLKPPYILEQWAIEVLKDVAAKMKVDESDTVTKEHVIALVAFAMGEGGDIMNDDIFNPLNTGLNAPELIDGAHDVSGVQAFKSFDAGVEATARTIVGSYQDRLADILIKPASTAKQFMYALTYFNKYPGNALWAGASVSDPDGYYQGRLDLIQQVRSNYKGTAGLVIGTSAFEQAENITKASLLQFDGGGGVGDDSGGLCDSNSGDAAAVAQTAVKLAWPDASHGTTPKPEYQQAINQYNKGMNPADCGVFVATVMRASGADPNYPPVGTAVQEAYVRSHPDKYDVVDKVNRISDLQPGDILIVNQGSGAGAAGHTYIFVGKQPGNGYDQASASLNSRAGNLGNAELSDSRGNYLRARLK
ncbi:MAG TPA: serine hydrolase [Candidatus Saccharimonadales bacterium]|nr:serine hydrolase [Candidatus Saccharimonadales bacterium]